jgi:hypothetical protein
MLFQKFDHDFLDLYNCKKHLWFGNCKPISNDTKITHLLKLKFSNPFMEYLHWKTNNQFFLELMSFKNVSKFEESEIQWKTHEHFDDNQVSKSS